MMNKKNAAGAYVIKHPHNQNRLLLHFFWNAEPLNDDFFQTFMAQALSATNFTANFYQYYVMDKTGTIVSDKKVVNPISSLFGEE
ncbi:hypothetical protein [Paenibacillus sp. DMB20]|uniref:hypothetical protein n=1 Tax=Paenibacillus sp. DMB20 TaxID=1642570 RepID=UPI001F1C75D5|nr:hypothetical protein [Paenibacillus sp. DMB20]